MRKDINIKASNINKSKDEIKRFFPTIDGLGEEQVTSRYKDGLFNHDVSIKTKTESQILFTNTFTFFNLINLILAFFVFAVGSYKNALFMIVVVLNTAISTFQEIRSKRTLDKLSLLSTPKAKVIRNKKIIEVLINDIVLDDVISLSSGNQIPCDSIVMEGEVEVNEALITGESDPITKKLGDNILSGSFIVSGHCYARVENVGKDNYANKIAQEAKYFKKPNSDIMNSLNTIVKGVSLAIVPIGIILFAKQYFIGNHSLQDSVVSTVAALIGMIPEGLILLTSVVFAISIIRLSRERTLVQELYCIETLARVDVLCLDKTGTITEGKMEVNEVITLDEYTPNEVSTAFRALNSTLADENPTANAIREHFGSGIEWNCTDKVAFSSARKWSGASYEDCGTYVIGAGKFILKDNYNKIEAQVNHYSALGNRVIVLAHSPLPFKDKKLPTNLTPIAIVVLGDKIRSDAKETIEYFYDQGVCLKVISGDDAITVANISDKAGIKNADRYIDASTLTTDEEIKNAITNYTVFGRVTPQQKFKFIKALKESCHTVAMTGDGVNDVLALKESDCSIAMASGSDAARAVSNLVLLDSNFSSLPKVVAEGRRSINNLQRSASLFLTKTIYASLLALIFIFVNNPYPFIPIQLTLISSLTIGIPSFILALEPNKDRVKGRFIYNVINKSIPAALSIVLGIVLTVVVSSFTDITDVQASTIAVLITAFTAFLLIFKTSYPFNMLRIALLVTIGVAFIFALLLFRGFFSLAILNSELLLIFACLAVVSLVVFTLVGFVVRGLVSGRNNKTTI